MKQSQERYLWQWCTKQETKGKDGKQWIISYNNVKTQVNPMGQDNPMNTKSMGQRESVVYL